MLLTLHVKLKGFYDLRDKEPHGWSCVASILSVKTENSRAILFCSTIMRIKKTSSLRDEILRKITFTAKKEEEEKRSFKVSMMEHFPQKQYLLKEKKKEV